MNDNPGIKDVAPLVMVGGDTAIPSGYYRILLVRRGALRLIQCGQERILLPRSAALILPRPDCRIAAGTGAEVALLGFGRSALDPDTLGAEAGRLLGLLGSLGPSAAAGPRAPEEVAAAAGCGIRVIRLLPGAFEEAWAVFRRLEGEIRDCRPGSETMQRLCLVELLMVFYRFGQSAPAPRGPDQGFRIEEAVRYIKERYAEEISLSEFAGRFGLNPSYLSRAFARHTGIHLFEYINRVRITKSCILLKRSSASIVEIAFAVGYNSLSHFNRYFRRVTGMSPREYRRRSRR
jgi:AraC-like DNA-binding protein